MKTSQLGIELIKSFEKLRLKAYKDSKGRPTIGYGCILYDNGMPVKMGDTITKERAEGLFKWQIGLKEQGVSNLINPAVLKQIQFDVIVCFTYNVGINGLKSSTLLKKLRVNPNDSSIANEFLKWNKVTLANGTVKTVTGLTIRRKKEAELYLSSRDGSKTSGGHAPG